MSMIRTIGSLLALCGVPFLTACVPGGRVSGLTEAPPVAAPSSTKAGFLPMKSAAGQPISLSGGWTYQPIESIQPTICGQNVATNTGIFRGPQGEMVLGAATSAAYDTTCANLLPPAVSGVAMVASATVVAKAIAAGSDTLASSIDSESATTADGLHANADAIGRTADSLQSAGNGLTANAQALAKLAAVVQCQGKAIPTLIAACIAALPK